MFSNERELLRKLVGVSVTFTGFVDKIVLRFLSVKVKIGLFGRVHQFLYLGVEAEFIVILKILILSLVNFVKLKKVCPLLVLNLFLVLLRSFFFYLVWVAHWLFPPIFFVIHRILIDVVLH